MAGLACSCWEHRGVERRKGSQERLEGIQSHESVGDLPEPVREGNRVGDSLLRVALSRCKPLQETPRTVPVPRTCH